MPHLALDIGRDGTVQGKFSFAYFIQFLEFGVIHALKVPSFLFRWGRTISVKTDVDVYITDT